MVALFPYYPTTIEKLSKSDVMDNGDGETTNGECKSAGTYILTLKIF